MTSSDERTRAFLDLIRTSRDERIAAIELTANREAGAILREARREARQRVHDTVAECRSRQQRALSRARASLDSLSRREAQRAHVEALRIGGAAVADALMRKWNDAESRRAWLDGLVAQAKSTLPLGRWVVEHPADLSPLEREALSANIASHCASTPELRPDPAATAGLRIRAASAVLDGTPRGLLQRRGDVDGRLLAELDALLEEAS